MSHSELDTPAISAAADRIREHIVRTPMLWVEERGLSLKCENRQHTGSFKLRGALNKILGREAGELSRGVVASSAGNHGLGVAFAAMLRGVQATIVVPRDAVRKKVEGILAFGASVQYADGGYARAEKVGRELAEQTQALWVSPYNDPEVIAGQATVGLEILEALAGRPSNVEWEVIVPVSGGGLIAGIGLAMRNSPMRVRIVGAQPEASPWMHAYFYGHPLEQVHEYATLADGLAGAVEAGAITFGLVRQVVHEMVLVSEQAIWEAMGWCVAEVGEVIEPSAAVALAAALARPRAPRVVVLSGGNADVGVLERVRSGR